MERNSDNSEPILNKTLPELPSESNCKLSTIIKITLIILSILILISILIFLIFFFPDNEIHCNTEFLNNKTCPVNSSYTFNSELSDFFTENTLNNKKWLNFNPTFLGRMTVGFLFASNNVEVKYGCLRLKARLLRESEKKTENIIRGYDKYATSIVKSKNKFLYGYFEIRAKTMKANVCNAFWLYDPLSDNLTAKFNSGNFSEEIDIFEVTSRKDYENKTDDCSKIYFNTVHVMKTPYLEAIVNTGKEELQNYTSSTKVDFNFCDDFHVYGFLWTEDKLVWYLDNKEYFSRENDKFKRPLHVTFDSEIMKNWFGVPNPEDLPAEFLIDYFRYWEL